MKGIASFALCAALATTARASNTLYLNFDGATIAYVQGGSDDARLGKSVTCGGTIAAWSSSVGAPLVTPAQAKRALTDRVRSDYLPFNVDVVTERPASGTYTMVLVGGTSKDVMPVEPANIAGVSTIDCGNLNPSNVVFAFAADLPPERGGLVALAHAIAHEAGHAYGLEHNDNPRDIMYVVQNPMQSLQQTFALQFLAGNFSSYNGPFGTQAEQCHYGAAGNSAANLLVAVGARADDGNTSPVLTWDFPAEPAQAVGLTLPLIAYANSTSTQVHFEIYRNFELVAVSDSAPLSTTVTFATGPAFVTVEAIDETARRSSITRHFEFDRQAAALCTDSCASGLVCDSGVCKRPFGAACAQSSDCVTNLCQPFTDETICSHSCGNNKDCPNGYVCQSSVCASPPRVHSGCALVARKNPFSLDWWRWFLGLLGVFSVQRNRQMARITREIIVGRQD